MAVFGLAANGALAQDTRNSLVYETGSRPTIARFASKRPRHMPGLSNDTLAQYVVDLSFQLEKGPARRRLAKWRMPLAVGLDWPGGAAYRRELERFLDELNASSRIELSMSDRPGDADIRVRVAPSIEMRRALGSSFCIAVPGDKSWPEFAADFANGSHARWSDLVHPRKATIFIPDTARPFLVRACLREELMQVLGPAGDFYFLAGSIFNDDQIHLQPTAFDFLVLRVLYDRRLVAGMKPDQVLGAAKAVLDDINRAGRNVKPRARLTVDRAWEKSFQLAQFMHHPKFASGYFDDTRAQTERMAAHDPRRLLTRLEAARNLQRYSPREAHGQLLAVARDYSAMFGPGNLYEATARLDAARIDLWFKNFAAARAAAVAALATFVEHGDERKVVEAMLIRDAADDRRQRVALVEDARQDTRSWAFYALGRRRQPVPRAPPPASWQPGAFVVPGIMLALGLAIYFHFRRRRVGRRYET